MTGYSLKMGVRGNNKINQGFGPDLKKSVDKNHAEPSWLEVYRQAENNAGLTSQGLVNGSVANGSVLQTSLDVNSAVENSVPAAGSVSAGAEYIKEPKRSDFNTEEEFYQADNKYIQALLKNPYALPDPGKTYKLTRPGGPGSRSTDVYERKIEDNMIKYLGCDGRVLWQVFVPNVNWHKKDAEIEDPAVGDIYSRNLSRYAAETVFMRGGRAGQANPILPGGEPYDFGRAYERFQYELYGKYGKMYGNVVQLGRNEDN